MNRVILAFSDIKIAHSVFALPFAVLGAFLATPAVGGGDAGGGWSRFAGQLALVVVCMVAARTWAMLVNRIVDRRFDAENPRTAARAVASGRLAVRDAVIVAAASAVIFVGCCALFWLLFGNRWPLLLSVPTLWWIAFYSFTKRFTWLSHVFLGGALAASPLAAAIAVHPPALEDAPAIWLLSAMVLVWVAGFDILYALQDIEFDRRTGLFSIPARLGPTRAAWVSRALHVAACAILFAAWRIEPRFGAVLLVAAVLVAGLLVAEHLHLRRTGMRGLPVSFGLINGVVSCLLGLAGIVDILR